MSNKNQSLIKENIHLHDLKPADVLIERFAAWKAIVQQPTAYSEVFFPIYINLELNYSKGIADIENNCERVD